MRKTKEEHKALEEQARLVREAEEKRNEIILREGLPYKFLFLLHKAQDLGIHATVNYEPLQTNEPIGHWPDNYLVQFTFHNSARYTLNLNTCTLWDVQNMESEFALLEIEKNKKEEKARIKKQVIAKLTKEERDALDL